MRKNKFNTWPVILIGVFLFIYSLSGYAIKNLTANEKKFIDELSVPGYSKQQLTDIVKQINYTPAVIQKITQPYEGLSWDKYRLHFITEPRINDGKQYINSRHEQLQQAYNKYGVDQDVITAILGVETFYGKYTGSYNVLDSLGTLAFYYPPRAAFFQKELKEFIRLSLKNKLAIAKLKGSYAGALGIPQFMPSSYLHYGVNANKTNQPIDLFTDHKDAIYSVANYLNKAGWQKGKPIACKVKSKKTIADDLVSSSAKAQHSLAWYSKHGVNVSCAAVPGDTMASLINMGNGASPEYWLVFKNFTAILRYNPRLNYAMAVYQLSEALKDGGHG